MSASSDDSEHHDPLEPVLREVEDELHRRLKEACEAEAEGLSSDSTEEIRRLEDSLLAAAVAADQTLTLRRHIERRKEAAGVAPEHERRVQQRPIVPDEPEQRPLYGVREFRDADGQLWRAWPVTPGARPGRTAERYLGEYHKGWICFEAMEGSARRRLPHQPPQWSELKDADLAGLLEQAITAPKRKERQWKPSS